jgi:hypothetical protein
MKPEVPECENLKCNEKRFMKDIQTDSDRERRGINIKVK